jgi:hypothetical protein
MERLRKKSHDIPGVVVTGQGSEEVAARFSEKLNILALFPSDSYL